MMLRSACHPLSLRDLPVSIEIGRSQSLEIMVWTSAGKLLEVKVVAPYYP